MWPVWELRGHGSGTREVLPPWFQFRLTFADGARVDVMAVVADDGRVSLEDLRAEPPLPLDVLGEVAQWIERPLADAWRALAGQGGGAWGAPTATSVASWGTFPGLLADAREREYEREYEREREPAHRARSGWPRGQAGRRIAAEAYTAAQREGRDPVLAVMCATGRSRRKSLRLIAGARDEGYLTPRHNRR
ncbi:DUF6214 family protein [Streptomyces sp. NPDC001941]|uniref:DUF6214 family protein n=1 Tax=Streptomyces sp. NPDC001941 TaxID=3154659 RepID=UPI00332D1457